MKKFNWDTPITWRSYGKLCKWSFIISILIGIVEIIYFCPSLINKPIEDFKKKFWKKVSDIKRKFNAI